MVYQLRIKLTFNLCDKPFDGAEFVITSMSAYDDESLWLTESRNL